jgi:rhamnulokinase
LNVPAVTPLFAAIDMGASSARLLAGRLQGGSLQTREVARLGNGPVRLPDGLHWDLLRLYQGMLDGLARLSGGHAGPLWVGIDGWGVDYGLLDRAGHLLGLPFHYRDPRTDGKVAEADALLGAGRAYEATGIQTMQINTIYQLMAERESAAYGVAHRLLLVPDLFGWLLTGQARREATNTSTTQMVDVRDGRPVDWLLDRLGLRTDLLAEPVVAGEVLGPILGPVADGAGVSTGAHVVAVATHDTASAVLAVPAVVEDFAYLVSGSWSLVGLELPAAVVDERTRAANFSNETGIDGTVRFLRNVMGHWVIQECERAWAAAGEAGPLAELLGAAGQLPPFRWLFDTASAELAHPGGMPGKVREACRRAGGPVPDSPPEIVRCTVDSMALAVAAALEDAQRCAGRRVSVLHVVGGGSANGLLLRSVAAATGLPVVAGPVEASAVGNMLVQMRAAGLVGDRASMRSLVAASFALSRVVPEPALVEAADAARGRLARAGAGGNQVALGPGAPAPA